MGEREEEILGGLEWAVEWMRLFWLAAHANYWNMIKTWSILQPTAHELCRRIWMRAAASGAYAASGMDMAVKVCDRFASSV